MNEEVSSVIIELAKKFIELVRHVEPRWNKAYYRFRSEGLRYGSNGSYVVDSNVVLVSAMKNAAFYEGMNETGAKLFSLLNKEKGVLLLIVDNDFNYDVKFEWDDLNRWQITKLNGATGVPEGF